MCDTGRKTLLESKNRVNGTTKDSALHRGPSGLNLIAVPVYY